MNQTAEFFLPPLFVVFCAMMAIGFVATACRWLWLLGQGEDRVPADFTSYVWREQFRLVVGVSAVSLVFNSYLFERGNADFPLVEAGFLIMSGAFFMVQAKRNCGDVLRRFYIEVLEITFLLLMCVLGWVFTFFVGWCLAGFLSFSGVVLAQDARMVGAVAVLLGWAACVFVFYYAVPKAQRSSEVVGHRKIHDFLWPLMFAYLMLLLPLQIQHVAVSKEWQDIKHAKPSLRRA